MDLNQLQREWQRFGEADPLWAILTHADRKDGGWDEAEFFETGRREVAAVLAELQQLGVHPRSGRALDFGCGVGRLTQALAEHFDEVTGVDIAPAMVERARAMNRHGHRCAYNLNQRADLSVFPDASFDFIYSNITLQHMEPQYSKKYIREFIRVLAPGGTVVFQIPHRATRFRVWLIFSVFPRWMRRLAFRWMHGRAPVMEMYAVPRPHVERILTDAGAPPVRVDEDHSGGPVWPGYRYMAYKPDSGSSA